MLQFAAAALITAPSAAQPPLTLPADANVVFGMYNGAALLMDVYRPARPNGRGVFVITGTAWTAYPASLSPKDSPGARRALTEPLLSAGYTVFMPNHRLTPGFVWPEPIIDVQRAVQFVRLNAQRFGVSPDPLAGVGMSSGAHLLSMAGVTDPLAARDEDDPVTLQSSRLQCVVALAAATDLANIQTSIPQYITLLMGAGIPPFDRERSPQSALRAAGVPVQLRRVPGAGHGLLRHPDADAFLREAMTWLDGC